MITEIEVEGIGTMRHLNAWQLRRLMRVKPTDRYEAPIAMALGMTLQQFRRNLSAEEQQRCCEAWGKLMSPDGAGLGPVRQAPRPPAKGEHVPIERQAELGARLIEVRRKLPRGHFRRWVEDESGISWTQACRFIKAARTASQTAQEREAA